MYIHTGTLGTYILTYLVYIIHDVVTRTFIDGINPSHHHTTAPHRNTNTAATKQTHIIDEMGKSKQSKSKDAVTKKCTCDDPFKCFCGNRPERPSKGHKWNGEQWAGKGHKQRVSTSTV